jgi:flavorubredoxin
MEAIDYSRSVEIAPNVFWIGYNIRELYFHTNPYLIIEGNEAALIDPGSEVDFEKVFSKTQDLIEPSKIKYIILQHQDPDLCGSTTRFERLSDMTVYMAERSSVFAKFYGIKSPVELIKSDGEYLQFKTGRKLKFFQTPYCHSPGAMVTYDEKSKILFTSDIFGAFNDDWELYEDMIGFKKHLSTVKLFMEPYMASKEAVLNFIKKVEKLDIELICPQHGSIIRKDVKKWFKELEKMNYGTAISERKSGLEFNIFK